MYFECFVAVTKATAKWFEKGRGRNGYTDEGGGGGEPQNLRGRDILRGRGASSEGKIC